MDDWIAYDTENEQGVDFRQEDIPGKVSLLEFTIIPTIIPGQEFWRAGFKLFDPNDSVLPLRTNNSFLFHLGSTPRSDEYGFTAYLNGKHLKYLNKTRKYPKDKILTIRVLIGHENSMRIYVNGLSEFNFEGRLQNPQIRKNFALLAWGDGNNYEVAFKDIVVKDWKEVKKLPVLLRQRENSPNKFIINGGKNLFVGNANKEIFQTDSSPRKVVKKIPWYTNANTWQILIAIVTLVTGWGTSDWWWPLLFKTDQISKVESSTTEKQTIVTPTEDEVRKGITVHAGDSYKHEISGVEIFLESLRYQESVDMAIRFPVNKGMYTFFEQAVVGKTFRYSGVDGKQYLITLLDINYNSIIIKINEQ